MHDLPTYSRSYGNLPDYCTLPTYLPTYLLPKKSTPTLYIKRGQIRSHQIFSIYNLPQKFYKKANFVSSLTKKLSNFNIL